MLNFDLCKRPSISHSHKNTNFVRDHHQMIINRISGVMVSVFASSSVGTWSNRLVNIATTFIKIASTIIKIAPTFKTRGSALS